jgi:hypothetical protein
LGLLKLGLLKLGLLNFQMLKLVSWLGWIAKIGILIGMDSLNWDH